jgi:hypothetical protein
MRFKFLFYLLLVTLVFGSCATIPHQAPALSEELGIKINSIEKSHIKLLTIFFNQKRELVDAFIVKEWIPIFAKEFFSDPIISSAWDEIVSSNSKEDRLQFIIQLGPKLQTRINQKRLELIQPLDDLQKEFESQILNEYNIAKSINNSLTSYLYSASKVDESRTKYMDMLGITDGKIDAALNKTDSIVNQLVELGNTALDKETQIKSYLTQIESIKEKLNTNSK